MSNPWEKYQNSEPEKPQGPWDKYSAPTEEPNLMQKTGSAIVEGVGEVGKFVDSYTGAPVRAGIGAYQDDQNPLEAAWNQIGRNPEMAPTGKEIAKKAGVPNTPLSDVAPAMFTENDEEAKGWTKFKKGGPADVTASGAAGLAIDIGADPVNLIPGAAIAKGVEVAGKGASAVAKIAGKATKIISNPVLDKAGDILRAATIKGGSTLTGMAEKNISTFIDKTDEVNKLIAKHGGDMSLAADELRGNLQSAIQTKIKSLNDEVRKAIDSAPPGSFASNDAIIKALDHVKSGINPSLYPGSISEIDDMILKVKGISKPPEFIDKLLPSTQKEVLAAIDADNANQAKRFLQDQAKGSYFKGGQLFTASPEASKAAKAGAREARKIEMELAPGTIAPNQELSRLHRYQDNVNKNLIAPGKTEAALMAAGAGQNSRNVKNLQDISKITGFDAMSEAEKLSASKAFSAPGWVPVDSTGKSGARMALAAFLGSMAAGPVGAAAGVAATSPAILKLAIEGGHVSKNLISKLAGGAANLSEDVLMKAINAAKTKEGQLIIRSMEKAPVELNIQEINKRGPEKWIFDGGKKLTEHDNSLDPAFIEQVKKSKKGRELLMRASELKPGSKQMDRLAEEIKQRGGE